MVASLTSITGVNWQKENGSGEGGAGDLYSPLCFTVHIVDLGLLGDCSADEFSSALDALCQALRDQLKAAKEEEVSKRKKQWETRVRQFGIESLRYKCD